MTSAPPGLEITFVESSQPSAPALQNLIVSAEYQVRLSPAGPVESLAERIEALLQATTLRRQRRGKDYDLRPLIEGLEIVSQEEGGNVLRMQLAAREGATGRPEEVLLALGLDPAEALIHRRGLVLAGPEAEV